MSAKKDVLVVVYSPRGGEEYALIPLSWSRPMVKTCKQPSTVATTLDVAKELLKYVDDRLWHKAALSHSVLYDLKERSVRDLISGLICIVVRGHPSSIRPSTPIDSLKNVIIHIIERNVKPGYRNKAREFARKVWEEELKPIIEAGVGLSRYVREGDGLRLVLLDLVDAVRLIRSGMR